MNQPQDDAIAAAKVERDRLCEECFILLHQISRKSCYLKLLHLAKNHLVMLASYKANRQQQTQRIECNVTKSKE